MHAERLAQLGQSLAEVMHDLRGPLTTISGFAELMSLELDAENRRDFALEIQRQVERLERLSAQTLAYASGRSALLLRPVHLNVLGAEIEKLLAHELCGTGITPSVEVSWRGTTLLDVTQVFRVVENLTRNAREAMAAGGGSHFAVAVARRGDWLVMTFTDDGPGLPQRVREHPFEPFVSDGKPGGTGLGLQLARKIARDHGGDAALVDVTVGTCIELRLPCRLS